MKLKIRLVFIFVVSFFINTTIYAYTAYKIGDGVAYNGIEFYVIKDSSSDKDSVTMLKKETLTVEEVNLYGGVGTANNHVNMYVTNDTSASYYQQADNSNGYGGVVFYSSSTCGYNGREGCITNYSDSEIKHIVESWANDKILEGLQETRLLNTDDIIENFGYEYYEEGTQFGYRKTENTPDWVYSSSYWYWMMSSYNDSNSFGWVVGSNGDLYNRPVSSGSSVSFVVRPVITLKKTAFGDEEESITDNTDEVLPDSKNNVDKQETTTKVKVENTYMSQTLIVMIIGFISICISVVIYYIIKNKRVIR